MNMIKHHGKIIDSSFNVAVGNIKKGQVIRLYILIDDNNIKDIKYEYFGCNIYVSILETICDYLIGKSILYLKNFVNGNSIDDIINDSNIHNCAFLIKDAFKELIKKINEE